MPHHPTAPPAQRTVTIVEIEGPALTEDNTDQRQYQVIDLQDEHEIACLPSPSLAHGKAFNYALRAVATLVVPHEILAAMQIEEDEREREHDRWLQEITRNPPF